MLSRILRIEFSARALLIAASFENKKALHRFADERRCPWIASLPYQRMSNGYAIEKGTVIGWFSVLLRQLQSELPMSRSGGA